MIRPHQTPKQIKKPTYISWREAASHLFGGWKLDKKKELGKTGYTILNKLFKYGFRTRR